jgi:hypothetical protein
MNDSPQKAHQGESAAFYASFRDALLDLSEEPTAPNVARYLVASRALDGQPVRARRREHVGHIYQESTR